MKKTMDKLKNRVKVDKNLLIFLLILVVVGIIVGSIFVTILNNEDQSLTTEYLASFLERIQNGQLDYVAALKNNLISNLGYILVIWLLGISVIGLPIIIIMYFSKAFILGFSIGTILFNYKLKGILFSLIYVFPGQIVNLLAMTVLMVYAISFSLRLIESLVKKKTLDFKAMINKYLIILAIAAVAFILTALYDTYIMPNILNKLMGIIT